MEEAVVRIVLEETTAAAKGVVKGTSPEASANPSTKITSSATASTVKLADAQFRRLTDHTRELVAIRRLVGSIADVVTGIRQVKKTNEPIEDRNSAIQRMTHLHNISHWTQETAGAVKYASMAIEHMTSLLMPIQPQFHRGYQRGGQGYGIRHYTQEAYTLGQMASNAIPRNTMPGVEPITSGTNQAFEEGPPETFSDYLRNFRRVMRRGVFGAGSRGSSGSNTSNISSVAAEGAPTGLSTPAATSVVPTPSGPPPDTTVPPSNTLVSTTPVPEPVPVPVGAGTTTPPPATPPPPAPATPPPPAPPAPSGLSTTGSESAVTPVVWPHHDKGWNLRARNKDELIEAGIRGPGDRSPIKDDEYARYMMWRDAQGIQGPPRFARGGRVSSHPGGPYGTDTIPAWLTKGEFVVNAQSAAVNRSLLERINNGAVAHMAEGGTVSTFVRATADPSDDPSAATKNLGNIITSLSGTLSVVHPALGHMAHAVGVVTNSLGSLNNTIDRTAVRYGEFSPTIAQSQAAAEARQAVGEIRRSREIGPALAGFVNAQSQLQQKFEDIKVTLLSNIVPPITRILEILETILPESSTIQEAISRIAVPLFMLAEQFGIDVSRRMADRMPVIDDPTSILFDVGRRAMSPPSEELAPGRDR